VLWSLADHQGTVRDLVEYDSGQDETTVVNHVKYDAFGNITAQSNSSLTPHFAYTGREWDPDAGLYYYRSRWYDPKTGRFLSEDAIGFAGGDANLQRYVYNNPLKFIDPTGMSGGGSGGSGSGGGWSGGGWSGGTAPGVNHPTPDGPTTDVLGPGAEFPRQWAPMPGPGATMNVTTATITLEQSAALSARPGGDGRPPSDWDLYWGHYFLPWKPRPVDGWDRLCIGVQYFGWGLTATSLTGFGYILLAPEGASAAAAQIGRLNILAHDILLEAEAAELAGNAEKANELWQKFDGLMQYIDRLF